MADSFVVRRAGYVNRDKKLNLLTGGDIGPSLAASFLTKGTAMKKRIHINQHVIRANKKNKEHNPPITVKTSKNNHYTYAAEIDGLSRVVYSPDKPLSCGAKVWIETDASVWIHTGEVIT